MSTTNILDLNNRIDALEKNSGGSADSAKRSDIATEFSATTAYTAGCFVYYEGKLYQFNADHTAGAWDPTDVVEANVTDQVVSNASAIAGLTASDVAYDNTTSGLTATNEQAAIDELAGDISGLTASDVEYVNTTSGLTATDVQGAVDEVLNAVMPRTASGTTLAQLVSAIDQLSEVQKATCTIDILCSSSSSFSNVVRRFSHRVGSSDIYTAYEIDSSSTKSIEWQLTVNGNDSTYKYLSTKPDGTTQTVDWTITNWTLYYQGTPIT